MLSKKKTGGFFFFLLLLLMAGFLAITQETDTNHSFIDVSADEFVFDPLPIEEFPEWAQLAAARWFRSNAGGMALEEIPSRLAALRNEYALVIDYIRADELPANLSPFYQNDYTIEIRVLYEQEKESWRQWLFRDTAGITRLVAVFSQRPDGDESEPGAIEDSEWFLEAPNWHVGVYSSETDWQDEIGEIITADDLSSKQTASVIRISRGFIDRYNEDGRINVEHQFSEDGEEIVSNFFYHDNTLVKAEGWRKMPDEELQKIYTDHYRYNRSAAFRLVERIYHAEILADPVRISFPYRVLDAARDDSFIYEPLPPEFDFFVDDTYAAEDYRMVYNTGERGRILTQTLLDDEGNSVWVVQNTWSGDRIIAILKIEGDEERLIEFEYDGNGNRILERNLRNGVLERLVRAEGSRDIEELYMDGVTILRAVWENGRKISEERIRSRQSPGNKG